MFKDFLGCFIPTRCLCLLIPVKRGHTSSHIHRSGVREGSGFGLVIGILDIIVGTAFAFDTGEQHSPLTRLNFPNLAFLSTAFSSVSQDSYRSDVLKIEIVYKNF